MNDSFSSGEPASRAAILAESSWALLKRHGDILALLAFAACFLSPVLRSPYNCDDFWNSVALGVMHVNNWSLWDLACWENKHYMNFDGRFFPITSLSGPYIHYYFHNLLLHKTFVLALVVSNLALFYWTLRRWHISRSIAQLGVVSLMLCFQMRHGQDPILAYRGMLQVLVAELLLSIICYQQYFRALRWQWLAGSVFFFGSMLLTYEVSFVLPLLFVAIAAMHYRRWKPSFWTARHHFSVALLIATFIMGLRTPTAERRDPGQHPYKIRWSTSDITETFGKQAGAALPMSYLAFCARGRHEIVDAHRLISRSDNWAVGVALIVLTLWFARRWSRDPDRQPLPFAFLAIGAIVWLGPGAPLALSPKYQQLVRAGFGYVPVYLQYFGVGIIAVWLFQRLALRFPRRWMQFAAGLAVVNGCVGMVTYDANLTVVKIFRKECDIDLTKNAEAAFAAGIGEPIPVDSTLLVMHYRYWLDTGWPNCRTRDGYFSTLLDRKVHVVNADPNFRPTPTPLCERVANLPGPVFALCENCLDGRSGYSILCWAEPSIDAQGRADTSHFVARRIRVFVRGQYRPETAREGAQLVAGRHQADGAASNVAGRQTVPWAQLRLLRQKADWAIYEGCFDAPVDVATVEMVEPRDVIRPEASVAALERGGSGTNVAADPHPQMQ